MPAHDYLVSRIVVWGCCYNVECVVKLHCTCLCSEYVASFPVPAQIFVTCKIVAGKWESLTWSQMQIQLLVWIAYRYIILEMMYAADEVWE